ncbi:MAG: glycosyltransferase [Bacteroidales bacterium]|nr:glycosyltransferase [Bacteroidales bacterium]
MKNPSKILFLARWYPDRYDPMMGLFIKRHAEVAAGFADVAVLYLRAAPDKTIGYEIDHKVETGIATTIVYYGTKSILPSFLIKRITGFLFGIAFIKGYRFLLDFWGKPDFIHVNVLTRLGIFALCLRKFHGIKYVITEHWSRYLPVTGTYKGFLRKYFTQVVVKNASAVSTVSENLAKAMQSHGLVHANFMVLPNVVDTEDYIPVLTESKNKQKRFIHISCFEDRSKNISGLLRAISTLAKLRNDFKCIMVGEGIDLEKMKTLSTELGLPESQVRFTGLLEGEKVVDAYQSAEFMVMFSNYENMPVVISESLSCGLPVIATAVGGIPEYLNEANGRLVSPGDEAALLGAINFMLDHSSDFDKKKIRQNAVGIFGKEAVSEKLKELYGFVK